MNNVLMNILGFNYCKINKTGSTNELFDLITETFQFHCKLDNNRRNFYFLNCQTYEKAKVIARYSLKINVDYLMARVRLGLLHSWKLFPAHKHKKF